MSDGWKSFFGLRNLVVCALTISLSVVESSVAQEPDPLELMQSEEDAFQAAVNRVQDSVVQIETFGGLQVVDSAAVSEGPSSGTVVGEDGWIITSQFQFRNNPASITVVLPDGSRKAARMVARDQSRELVLLKIEVDHPLPVPKPADRKSLQVGQWAIALGKTFDSVIASRSVGIVSALYRIWNKAVQADAKISPMNYGGPLIDIQGNVIGVLAPIDPGIATEGEVQQWYDSGVGFAIPFEDILARVPLMQSGKDIRSGLMGFRPKTKDDFDKSVIIAGVIPGTPLSNAGIRKGDRIVSINGQEVKFVNNLRHLLGPIDAGQKVTIRVERDGKVIEKECELVAELPKYSRPFVGLIPQVNADKKQLKIVAVEPDSPADKAGIKVGDVILQVGGEAVGDLEQFRAKLEFSDYRQALDFQLIAGESGETRTISVNLIAWPQSSELSPPNAKDILPQAPSAQEKSPATGLVDVPFADIPNKVFAYVPAEWVHAPVGLFIMAAEPGVELDRQKVVDAWQSFCRDHAFAICVVGPASPEAWEIEELEIFKRTLSYMQEKYKIDDRQCIVGGFGSGGMISLIAAFENKEQYRALVFNSERVPGRMKIPAVEPQMGVDILLGKESEATEKWKQGLLKEGYRVESLNSESRIDDDSQSAVGKHLRNYLDTLSWY